MLDPLATFLLRILNAGNDVAPAGALFTNPDALTDDQRAMVDELTRRSRENGYITDAGDDRVSVTADGQRFLEDVGL